MNLKILNRSIGRDAEPFVIAEMSGNHNRSLERALSIVKAAAESGAHAIKIQTYTPDSMTLDLDEREFRITDKKSLWYGKSLYQVYSLGCTPYEWHREIFEAAHGLGIIPFSTPFDMAAVEFLETLNAPCYKIASFENTDVNLLRAVAATGKPLIISTGMATAAELDESVSVIRDAGCKKFVLLKCTSTYPSLPFDSNLYTIPHMSDLFKCEVGISDHTLGMGVALAAVALGATVIEKHFTLDRADGGIDSAFSVEPHEMQQLVLESKRAWQSLGTVSYGPTEAETTSLGYRRSLYVVKNLKSGDMLTTDNVRAIRPGLGLATKHLPHFLGKKISKDVARGTALTWDLLL